MVKRGNKVLLISVRMVLLSKEILNAFVIAPLYELCNLIAHEVELSARVCHLIERKGTHAGKLAPPIARHTGNEAALTMNHLIMAQRKHKVLVELIHGGKRQKAMVTGAEGEVRLAIMQRVIHPSHIPLQMEPKTAHGRRIGYQRPRR